MVGSPDEVTFHRTPSLVTDLRLLINGIKWPLKVREGVRRVREILDGSKVRGIRCEKIVALRTGEAGHETEMQPVSKSWRIQRNAFFPRASRRQGNATLPTP